VYGELVFPRRAPLLAPSRQVGYHGPIISAVKPPRRKIPRNPFTPRLIFSRDFGGFCFAICQTISSATCAPRLAPARTYS
jgi:hypothetical protein